MTHEEFVKLVEAMRAYQRLYFRNRSETALRRCKELEREVDASITKFQDKQGEIF